MATGIAQLQRYDVTIVSVLRKEPLGQGETLPAGELTVPVGLPAKINALWAGQIDTTTLRLPVQQTEQRRWNPVVEEIVTGWEYPDWSLTTHAWSLDMMELHERRVSTTWTAQVNSGRAGVQAGYAAVSAASMTGIASIDEQGISSGQPSSQNLITVNFRPLKFEFFGDGGRTIVEVDIANQIHKEYGINLLAGYAAHLA